MRIADTMQELAEAVAHIPKEEMNEFLFLVRIERMRQLPNSEERIERVIRHREVLRLREASERNDPRLRRIRLRNGIQRR
jgi:hypothetical protein